MFQPAGIVIVFQTLYLVGKSQGNAQLHLIIRLILPVSALSLTAPVLDRGQRRFAGNFPDIVCNAIFIEELLLCKGAVCLFLPEHKQQVRVYNCLPPQCVTVVIIRHVNFRKDIQIRHPAGTGAGLLFPCRLFFQAANIFPFFKVQVVLIAVPNNFHIHIGRCKLGGTQTQAVESQGIGIVVLAGIIFSSGIQFTVYQFPVIPIFILVKIHRTSTAEVLYFYRVILILRHNNFSAVSCAGFINGIGNDFKNRMGTAIQTI